MRYLILAIFLFAPVACASPLEETPEGNYDLVAVEVVHTPENVVVGDEVVFVNHLTNQGTDAIPPRTYRVDFYVDGERVSFDHGTGGLESGGTSTYSKAEGYYRFKPTEPGTYTYRWILDKENNLPETDETNNVIEGTIVVAERSAEHDKLLDQLELIGRNMVDGRYPPELELGPFSTHKELQWFTELFDDIKVEVDPFESLTHRESAPPREKAIYRLFFKYTGDSKWSELFVRYFDGKEWAKQATREFDGANKVEMTVKLAHDEQAGTFRIVSNGISSSRPNEMGWLGVQLTGGEAESGVDRTAVVHRVKDGSPAQEAGFEQGDILFTLAEKPIISRLQLGFLLDRIKPGTEVAFGLVRNGVQLEKTVPLGTQPAPNYSSD